MVITAQGIAVKPGYKLTEAGVIPDDWEVTPLTELAVIQHGYGFQSQYFRPIGKYRLTTPGHFYETGGFRDVGEKQKFYEGPFPESYVLSEGDLIVAMTEQTDGLLGSAARVPMGNTYLHNQRLGKVKVLSPRLSIRFLYHVFNSDNYRAKVRETAAGTKVKHTSPSKLLEIPVLLPPTKAEQEAISTALSDVEALLISLGKLITKKRGVKQATLHQLLTGKMRLPGFSGEWEVKRIEEIADIISGGTPSTTIAHFWQGDIRWCTPTDITKTQGKYLNDTEKSISKAGLKSSSARLLPIGSLLLCSRATIGEIRIAMNVVCTNQGFKSLVCLEKVYNEFLYYVILTIKPRLIEKAIGSTFLEISKRDLAALEISLPPFPEQVAIAAILSDMDAEIVALERERAKMRALKHGMMQDLLTGRIRLL